MVDISITLTTGKHRLQSLSLGICDPSRLGDGGHQIPHGRRPETGDDSQSRQLVAGSFRAHAFPPLEASWARLKNAFVPVRSVIHSPNAGNNIVSARTGRIG